MVGGFVYFLAASQMECCILKIPQFLYKGKCPETPDILIQNNGQYPQILTRPFLKLTFMKAEMMRFRTARMIRSTQFSTWAAKYMPAFRDDE